MEWTRMKDGWTRMKDGWNGTDKNEVDGMEWTRMKDGWMDEWTRRMKG